MSEDRGEHQTHRSKRPARVKRRSDTVREEYVHRFLHLAIGVDFQIMTINLDRKRGSSNALVQLAKNASANHLLQLPWRTGICFV